MVGPEALVSPDNVVIVVPLVSLVRMADVDHPDPVDPQDQVERMVLVDPPELLVVVVNLVTVV